MKFLVRYHDITVMINLEDKTLMRVEKKNVIVFVILIVSLISFGFFQVHLFHHVGMNEVRVFLKHFKILFAFHGQDLLNQRPGPLICRTHHPSKRDSMLQQKSKNQRAFCCAKREATEIQQPRVWMTTAVKWSDIENQW